MPLGCYTSLMANPSVVTLSLPQETIEKMKSFYAEERIEPNSPYIQFAAKTEDVAITAYTKEKQGLYKVIFQGEDALHESMIWGTPDVKDEPKVVTSSPKKQKSSIVSDQIGSDEVGTGDFFGPVIVVAAYVRKQDMPLLQELGVTDSKLLSDDHIREIGPKLIHAIDYSSLRVPNEKYNEAHDKGLNMNAVKAKLHNRALLNLRARHKSAAVYQDQFAAPSLYFSYLKEEKEVLRDITFATKGESKFPSVAAASVIARYHFLRCMDELGERYGCIFPLGASEAVDEFARKFVTKYGKQELRNVAKLHFANAAKL